MPTLDSSFVTVRSRRKLAWQFPFILGASVLFISQQLSSSAAQGQTTGSPTKLAFSQSGQAGDSSLHISAGDLLDVEVFATPELSAPRVRVSHDGSIVLPVAGSIQVAGLTPREADVAIETRLREQQILLSPSVTVLVSDYATKGVDVLGEVKAPGIYTFLGKRSLYDALSAAGGVTPLEGSTITISHPKDPDHPLIIKVTDSNFSSIQQSTFVEPGDVVEVSRADSVYVVGDVSHSGQFPIQYGRPLTALYALSLAGPNLTAKLTKASIVRKTASGGAQLIPLNMKDIEKTAALDPILQPDDVLVIPRSDAKAMLDILIPGATATVIGAIAYGYIRN